MSYKIKNGVVYVQYDGKWWIDEVLYSLFPTLKDKGLNNG